MKFRSWVVFPRFVVQSLKFRKDKRRLPLIEQLEARLVMALTNELIPLTAEYALVASNEPTNSVVFVALPIVNSNAEVAQVAISPQTNHSNGFVLNDHHPQLRNTTEPVSQSLPAWTSLPAMSGSPDFRKSLDTKQSLRSELRTSDSVNSLSAAEGEFHAPCELWDVGYPPPQDWVNACNG
ncbi:MAG: hypothetical protein ACOVQM_12790, partial [Pirellula sp.]